jgi:hypothetical protein
MSTCVFLLHQESFDMILVNNSSFYDGGITGRVLGGRTIGRLGDAVCGPYHIQGDEECESLG